MPELANKIPEFVVNDCQPKVVELNDKLTVNIVTVFELNSCRYFVIIKRTFLIHSHV